MYMYTLEGSGVKFTWLYGSPIPSRTTTHLLESLVIYLNIVTCIKHKRFASIVNIEPKNKLNNGC